MSQSLLNNFLHCYVSYKHIYNNAVTVFFLELQITTLLHYYNITTTTIVVVFVCCWT